MSPLFHVYSVFSCHHISLKNYATTLFLGSKWPQWRDLSNKPSMDIVIAILLLQSTKNRFSAIIRDNVARRHYFGIRGPTSKYYYGKAIWVRNLIFVGIFLICNELNLVYWKLSSNAFRNMNSSGGSFWPPASVISELRKGSGMEGLIYIIHHSISGLESSQAVWNFIILSHNC